MSDAVSLEELKRIFFYDPETGNFYRLKSIRNLRKGDIAGSLNKSGYTSKFILTVRDTELTGWLFSI